LLKNSDDRSINKNSSNSIGNQETSSSTSSTSELLTEFKTEATDITRPDYNVNPEYYYTKGKSFFNVKNYSTAIYYFEKSIEKDDKCVEAYCGKGDCFYNKNSNEEAIKAFEKAIQLDASCADALNGIGLVKADEKDFLNAISFYDRAIGEFYLNKGDSLDAIEEGEKAI
jgi:tetratricopeptide (TPR) repeat protein